MDYFITGTRAYGPAGEDSDLDIVMKENDALVLKGTLEDMRIETFQTDDMEEYGTESFYFSIGNLMTINVISLTLSIEFDAWKKATERMKLRDPIEDRERRLKTFQLFVKKYLFEREKKI